MKHEFEKCSLETLEGIERAEELKEKGWTAMDNTPFSITMVKWIGGDTDG